MAGRAGEKIIEDVPIVLLGMRSAVATGRLSLTAQGLVRYTLKTPYRDGATHVVFEPLDFIAWLAALLPKPRVHLTRFHGVFALHSALRAAAQADASHRH